MVVESETTYKSLQNTLERAIEISLNVDQVLRVVYDNGAGAYNIEIDDSETENEIIQCIYGGAIIY